MRTRVFKTPLVKRPFLKIFTHLRILPSSHTNPIFALVDGKPIRASKRSAEWCLKGVDQCWSQKERFYKPAEMEDAKQAYAHARETYKKILAECDVD